MTRVTLLLGLWFCLFVVGVHAQPTQIQLDSLEVKATSGTFAYLAFNSNEVQVAIAGGDLLLPSLFNCRPCVVGTTVDASISRQTANPIQFGGQGVVNGTTTSLFFELEINSSTPPFIIPAFYPSRRPFSFRRNTQLSGVLKIYTNNGGRGELLYTAPFDVPGRVEAEFGAFFRVFQDGRRRVSFGRATYRFGNSNQTN